MLETVSTPLGLQEIFALSKFPSIVVLNSCFFVAVLGPATRAWNFIFDVFWQRIHVHAATSFDKNSLPSRESATDACSRYEFQQIVLSGVLVAAMVLALGDFDCFVPMR
jgi:hypothetical protein